MMRQMQASVPRPDGDPLAGPDRRSSPCEAQPTLPGCGWFVAALLLAAAIYWPLLDYPFIQDDWIWIRWFQQHPVLETITRLLDPTDRLFYRPLSALYKFAMYGIFGLDALPAHLGAVLLLAGAIFTLARVVTRLTADAFVGRVAGAAYGGMLSIHLETMLWMVGVNDLGAALCVLIAVDAALSGRHRTAGLMVFAALLFKEAAAFAVVLVPLLMFLDPAQRARPWRGRLGLLLPVLPAITLLALVRSVAKSPLGLPPSHPYVFDAAWQVPWQLSVTYVQWVLEALLPGIAAAGWFGALFSWLPSHPGAALAAFLAVAGALAVVTRRLLAPPAGGEPFPAAPGVLAAWAVLGLLPVLLLRNHLYRYYLVYSIAPLLGLLVWVLTAGARRSLGTRPARLILPVLVAIFCTAAAIQCRRLDATALTAPPMGGTNDLLRRGRTTGIVREGLARLHPDPPVGSVFVFDFQVWSFGRESGPQSWYRRRDLEVLALEEVSADAQGLTASRSFRTQIGQASGIAGATGDRGADTAHRLDPTRTYFFSLDGDRLVELSAAEFLARAVSLHRRRQRGFRPTLQDAEAGSNPADAAVARAFRVGIGYPDRRSTMVIPLEISSGYRPDAAVGAAGKGRIRS